MEADTKMDELMSLAKFADWVGLSPSRVRKLISEGRLEYVSVSPKRRLLTRKAWFRFCEKNTTTAKEGEISAANAR